MGVWAVGRYYNFKSVELVHMGTGPARIVGVTGPQLRYLDDKGAERIIDLDECARIYLALRNAGQFPPSDDTDWSNLAGVSAVGMSRCVGLRAVLDEPPWFQFLDRRRTQFEFPDDAAIQSDLLRPLAAAGWQTWDAS